MSRELRSYYVTEDEQKLLGTQPGGAVSTVSGPFVRFDEKTRVLLSAGGVAVYLPAAEAESSAWLRQRTDVFLRRLAAADAPPAQVNRQE